MCLKTADKAFEIWTSFLWDISEKSDCSFGLTVYLNSALIEVELDLSKIKFLEHLVLFIETLNISYYSCKNIDEKYEK